jgi:uncharacterized protein (DUF983 family)
MVICPNCHRLFSERYGVRCPHCKWIYTTRTVKDVIADAVFALITVGVVLAIVRLGMWAAVAVWALLR